MTMKQILLRNLAVLLFVMLNFNTFGQIIKEDKGYYKGHKWEIDIYGPCLMIDGSVIWTLAKTKTNPLIMITPWQVGDELFFQACRTPGKKELYDFSGNLIIPYRFNSVYSEKIGDSYLLKVEKESIYDSYIDLFSTKGQLLVADACNDYGKGLTYITKDADYGEIFRAYTKDGCGVYNTKGETIIPAKYEKIEWTKDEDDNVIKYEITNNNNYIGIMDRNKNWTVPLNKQYKEIKRLSLGDEIYFLCRKLENNDWAYSKYALYNSKSNEVLPPVYTSISSIDIEDTPYFKCYKDGYCGLYDNTGKEIISPDYNNLQYLGSNYIGFKLNGYWGVMTMQGKVIIPTSRRYTNIGRYIKNQKRFTYSMDGFEGECNHLGQQISKRRVAKPNPQSSVVSQKTEPLQQEVVKKEETPQKQEEKKIIIEHKHDPIPVQVWKPCNVCGGSGRCQVCGGSGVFTGWSGNKTLCSYGCGGSGRCSICAGQGGHYEVEYR